MATQVLFDKLVPEILSIDIDMLSRLAVGETIATAAAAISVHSGTDATPSTMLLGLPTISGSIVTQKVQAGLPGVIYKLAISIRTNNNNILINEAMLAVRSSNAATPA